MGKLNSALGVGTVGYAYRDWQGLFYPAGASARRQLNIYSQHFNVCELAQFANQLPEKERIQFLVSQIKTDLKFLVRIHTNMTHSSDVGFAFTIAKHFRSAMMPMHEAGKLAGLVAQFPYAFKNTQDSRDYIRQLSVALGFDQAPLQLDFRHPSWTTPKALDWLAQENLAFVLVDEPNLPGLVPPLVTATTRQVLVRLHGRNSDTWWSGNTMTRHDYSYSDDEMRDLIERYSMLIQPQNPISGIKPIQVNFLFQNHWQAQSVRNAIRWKELLGEWISNKSEQSLLRTPIPNLAENIQSSSQFGEDDSSRPPMSVPFSEVKSIVAKALALNDQPTGSSFSNEN